MGDPLPDEVGTQGMGAQNPKGRGAHPSKETTVPSSLPPAKWRWSLGTLHDAAGEA